MIVLYFSLHDVPSRRMPLCPGSLCCDGTLAVVQYAEGTWTDVINTVIDTRYQWWLSGVGNIGQSRLTVGEPGQSSRGWRIGSRMRYF